jgi:hypothetical protein
MVHSNHTAGYLFQPSCTRIAWKAWGLQLLTVIANNKIIIHKGMVSVPGVAVNHDGYSAGEINVNHRNGHRPDFHARTI